MPSTTGSAPRPANGSNSRRDPAGCLRAFVNNQYVGLVVFVGILLEYVYAE